MCWEPNSSPLEQQQVFLTAEPSSQSSGVPFDYVPQMTEHHGNADLSFVFSR